jgi:two-component system chemotaxis sensor kinase CheA
MSLDISRFRHIYFAEAQQHLSTMETLLLELDVDDPDIDLLNFIIHEANSLACASGLFGYTDLTDVAHALESLLTHVWGGDLPLRSEMIDALLAASDVLKMQLHAHREGTATDHDAVDEIRARLMMMTIAAMSVPHASYGLFEPSLAGQ